MQHYQNFKIASYVRGEFLAQTDLSEIQKGIDFFKQYLGLDKVYLDTHREIYDVPKDKLQKIKKCSRKPESKSAGPSHQRSVYLTTTKRVFSIPSALPTRLTGINFSKLSDIRLLNSMRSYWMISSLPPAAVRTASKKRDSGPGRTSV